jgi:two-component system chemotaxis response regulator CheB
VSDLTPNLTSRSGGVIAQGGRELRVLVVDDSAFMRQALSRMINAEPGLRVIDTARDGRDAIEKAKALRPDVVTLDIEMPIVDGLTALRTIRRECNPPPAILMCSSLTSVGSQAALQSLRFGAADVIAKDSSGVSLTIDAMREELVAKVLAIGGAVLDKQARQGGALPGGAAVRSGAVGAGAIGGPATGVGALNLTIKPGHAFKRGQFELILIGSSTGGPPVLETLVPAIAADPGCPVVIAQHMPALFTRSLAGRLAEASKLKVVHAEHGTVLLHGHVYMCPGGTHSHIVKSGAKLTIGTSDEPKAELYRPGVNVLFSTGAKSVSGKVLGVVLTGMGDDGGRGAIDIKARGGTIIAQDQDSSIVYGMPKSVVSNGTVDGIMNPDEMAALLASMCLEGSARSAA